MKRVSLFMIVLCCMGVSFCASAQVKRSLIIGRTTGTIAAGNGLSVRVYGFTRKLSDQLTLPGTTIDVSEGDSVEIDFWNVSQGDPHDIQISGIEVQKQNQRLAVDADKAIRHMEHGYYSFVASHPGTYIYYSPVNYPFDVQAGMFGILIITPKQQKETYQDQVSQEKLWCGFEIDTNWHTDSVLDEERGENPRLTAKLIYHPQYFFVNDRSNHPQPDTAMAVTARRGEHVLIRLANAGSMDQLITFPKGITLKVITKNADTTAANATANTLHLKPMETCEVLISSDVALDGFVSYAFLDKGQDRAVYTRKIPVFITQ